MLTRVWAFAVACSALQPLLQHSPLPSLPLASSWLQAYQAVVKLQAVGLVTWVLLGVEVGAILAAGFWLWR